ncbi:DUF2797 domain-containing protein [Haloarcula halophila]|uniref:DUF2797 domain-containing protein n=1 Tax=Haloarcula TaxID=2237 RepID=UPI0023E45E77|nr:DUF2797 domain-containing protein [Halomicroarcula sp. DFY41]
MQVVGYRPRDTDPAALVLAEERTVELRPLVPGTELSYTLGSRHCAGTVDGEVHYPCANDTAPYCPEHTDRWPCARCTGDCDKPLDACEEEHAVYLAAFAPDVVKVGVTRSWRLETRLREQGADRAAHLRTVADGRIARQVEADIATDLGDRVRVPTKIDGLADSVDERWWKSLLERFAPIETYDFDYGLDLADRPLAETLATGTVRGTKGRVAVLSNNGSTYAVNLRDLVGCELDEGSADRDLQSSLGAF